jgi:hypothetical protein
MKMDIVPFEQVGNLVFGTKREIIRSMLGPDFNTSRKGPAEMNTFDIYPELDLHLYYNEQDELDYVEMGFHITPILEGINLREGSIGDMIKKLQKFDPNPQVDNAGAIFYKLGIALYGGMGDDEIELVAAFSKNYSELLRTTDINELANATYGPLQ